MKRQVCAQLLALNRQFYRDVAPYFAETRTQAWPGFVHIRDFLMQAGHRPLQVLDAGCGNGRLYTYLAQELALASYVGLDANAELLARAQARSRDAGPQACFWQADLVHSPWPDLIRGCGLFDAVFCLATLHHIPSRALRTQLMAQLAQVMQPRGHLILSNWQPLHSPREMKKIVDWSFCRLPVSELEAGDYLFAWNRGTKSVRYVHCLTSGEVEQMAVRAGLQPVRHFQADGATHNLNLYSILRKT